MKSLLWGLALLPLALAGACTSGGSGGGDGSNGGTGGDGGTCTTSGTTTVTIAVNGLPSGVNGSVDITSPDSARPLREHLEELRPFRSRRD